MRNMLKIIMISFIVTLFTVKANAEEMVTIRANNFCVISVESNRNYFIEPESNRLMIPMSMATETLGVEFIGYDKEAKQHIYQFSNKEIRLAAGDKKVLIDESVYMMDVAPLKKENVLEIMFVPIRLFIDVFEIKAEWNHEWKELSLIDERLPVAKGLEITFGFPIHYDAKDDYALRLVSYSLLANNDKNISLTFENISKIELSKERNFLNYWTGPGFAGMRTLDVDKLKKNQKRTYSIDPRVGRNSRSYIIFLTAYDLYE